MTRGGRGVGREGAASAPDVDATPGVALPRLGRSFYTRDTVTVARALLGQRLVRRVASGRGTSWRRLAGRIVEVEAYLGVEDAAAHTFGGRRTAAVDSMWQVGGTAYVYFTYGMHHCLNVVTQQAGEPTAVLIRAIEPLEGLDVMRRLRPAARRDRDLTSGPAKLTQALGLRRADHDGLDLTAPGELWIERERQRALPARRIATGPRVGIGYAARHAGGWHEAPLRFWIADNPHVSRA